MWGVRHTSILVLIFIALLLIGCESSQKSTKTVDRRPIVETKEVYSEEPYTVEKTRVAGEECIERHYSMLNNSKFNISIGPKEWVDDNLVIGQSSHVRRIVNVFNARDEVDMVYLDKIYLQDGEEIRRSKFPMKFLIDPKSIRKLYVMWDTQYDPGKDVTVDFTNNTEATGYDTRIMRMCINQTEKYNETEYKKVLAGTEEEVTGYEEVIRVKLER